MKYRARRRVTSFDVTVQSGDSTCNASIADVTEGGARLKLDLDGIEDGDSIALALQGKQKTAKVIWHKDGEAGIAFDELLPLDVLAAINHSLHRPRTVKKKRFLMR